MKKKNMEYFRHVQAWPYDGHYLRVVHKCWLNGLIAAAFILSNM